VTYRFASAEHKQMFLKDAEYEQRKAAGTLPPELR